jgi:glyoxylase-like metal-dependent hydrolase (beta-lactamase superfamily II)
MQVLDLRFMGHDDTVASFLVPTDEGLVLIESGPFSTFRSLEEELHRHGYALSDVRHVLLTHIHFDHAGAAWALAESGATVHVHPFGAGHMADPAKLYRSAQRIYGEAMETLWGEMRPIAPERLHAIGHGESLIFGGQTFTAWHTPGHAVHHIAYQWGREVFCGDVAGVRIGNGPVTPPCPPPDIHLPDWKKSLQLIRELRPEALWLTHFGRVDKVDQHLDELETALDEWAAFIQPHWARGDEPSAVVAPFADWVHHGLRQNGLGDAEIARYEGANPAFMSVAGLYRYWQQMKDL